MCPICDITASCDASVDSGFAKNESTMTSRQYDIGPDRLFYTTVAVNNRVRGCVEHCPIVREVCQTSLDDVEPQRFQQRWREVPASKPERTSDRNKPHTRERGHACHRAERKTDLVTVGRFADVAPLNVRADSPFEVCAENDFAK
jgi:hypothetical protein